MKWAILLISPVFVFSGCSSKPASPDILRNTPQTLTLELQKGVPTQADIHGIWECTDIKDKATSKQVGIVVRGAYKAGEVCGHH